MIPPAVRILVVDDDPDTCQFISELLAADDRDIRSSCSFDAAVDAARAARPDIVISDINLEERRTGLDLLRAMATDAPGAPVILISGFGTLDTAVQAVRAGAFDYISKPFNIAEVKATVARALARRAQEPAPITRVGEGPPPGLVGRTAPMLAVYKQIAYAADTAVPVLVVGESGTGKELVARAIHDHSRRAGRPFVAVNCGALADTLLESELFGHVRGAFTGAVADHKGLFEQATGGTMFLDEIGETTPALQVKLLRVLQEGELRPVGGTRPLAVNVRVVAATNTDLEKAVREGRFRQDLFYRLGVVVITLPPLHDRRDDIPLLVEHFVASAGTRAGRRVTVSPAAMTVLRSHPWPGNVRELENTIERLVVFSRGATIEPEDLPPRLQQAPSLEQRLFADLPTLDEIEKRYLLHVLEAVGGNRSRAAETMGIDRRTLYRMAERFGIALGKD